MAEIFFRVVRHHQVQDYMNCGWMIAEDLGTPMRWHEYAVYMKWVCECPMIEPKEPQ